MKKHQLLQPYACAPLLAAAFLAASGISISSAFSECLLTVYVMASGSQVSPSEIAGLNVKVISLDKKESYQCPFAVGQEVQIEKSKIVEKASPSIQYGDTLKMQYDMYSGMGGNGVAVSSETWNILGLVKARTEQQSEDSGAKSDN